MIQTINHFISTILCMKQGLQISDIQNYEYPKLGHTHHIYFHTTTDMHGRSNRHNGLNVSATLINNIIPVSLVL